MNKEKEIEELLTRGVSEIVGKEKITETILSGRKLRVKLGLDPTSPDMHIGRSVPLLKMRDFQKLGHTAVLIVGDFTGVIGDTSDKDSERPMLDKDTITKNKEGYFNQIGKIIDLEQAELRYNSEWLERLTYREIGEHADQFSIADFIARDNIKKRLKAGKRVSLREALYPIMQAFDSVAVEADVELGGVDQRFNLLTGRTLQEYYKQTPQSIVMTTFPVLGLDGRKMSSSWSNTINFNTPPLDMYGKIMSLSDEQVPTYFDICTRVSRKEIKEALEGHPKEAKMKLAYEITKIYHGEDFAEEAQESFINTFSKGEISKDIETVEVSKETPLVDILLDKGLVSSKTEFNRLDKAGAIKEIENGVYRIGKHRFIKVVRV